MFSKLAPVISSTVRSRLFSTSPAVAQKVAVLGAAGGIGQPLSLLIKNTGCDLSLYDVAPTAGVAADISHICTSGNVEGYSGDDIGKALDGANIVVIPAGVPRKPGMSRDDLFNTNATIVYNLADACAKHCPKAHLLIISNPVNSTVPIVAETLKKHGVYDPQRLFGVTTLDVTRAKRFIAETKGIADPQKISVPVIGGHAGETILPLLSKATYEGKGFDFTDEERAALTHRIQFGGDEVVKAKDGAGSATLSMAFAGAVFTEQLLNATGNTVACSYVQSDVTAAPYFATHVTLGQNGIEKIHAADIEGLHPFEQEALDKAVPTLQAQINKGIEFVKNK